MEMIYIYATFHFIPVPSSCCHHHLLFDPQCEVVVCFSNAVWDAIGDTLLPYVVIVNQCPVPESERRARTIAIYYNLQ